MRTVLDDDNCPGRLQLAHIYRKQVAVAKLGPIREAPAASPELGGLNGSAEQRDPSSRLPQEHRKRHLLTEEDRSEPAMPNIPQEHRDRRSSNNYINNINNIHTIDFQRTEQANNLAQSPLQAPQPPAQLSNGVQHYLHQRRVGHFQTPPSQYQAFKNPCATNARPKIYPNNTLVEDLSKCHHNLWPKAARATSKTIQLIKSCLPKEARSASADDKQLASAPNGFNVDLEHQAPISVIGANYGNDCLDASTDHSKAAAKKKLATIKQKTLKTRSQRECRFPMPTSISRLNSTLTQDDYNRALGVLTNDIRFQLHIFLYQRLQTIWVLFSTILCILVPLLLSINLGTLVIFGACSLWLFLQAAGLALSGRCRRKLDRMLERSVAQVNSYFMDHKLMLGVINAGGICKRSRLVIPLVYFDTFECIEQIESIVSADLKSIEADRSDDHKKKKRQKQQRVALDYSKIGLQKMEPNQRALAKSQLAKKIVLRFSQRWISHFDRSKLMFTDDGTRPRHLSTGKCLCQFIEEQFKSDQCEQIKDLDEPLDGCCDDMKKEEISREEKPTMQRQRISATLLKLNRSKSQAQQQQQDAERETTEATTSNDDEDANDDGDLDGDNEAREIDDEEILRALANILCDTKNGRYRQENNTIRCGSWILEIAQ